MTSMEFFSNPISLAVLALIVSLLAVQILSRKLNQNQRKKKYHPVAGTTFHLLLNFNRLHHYMTDLAGKYKTYRILSLFRNEIYTADPANVEYILKTNFENYGKGRHNYMILKDLLGDGIFTVDGDKWLQQRKLSSHEFSTRMLRDFSRSSDEINPRFQVARQHDLSLFRNEIYTADPANVEYILKTNFENYGKGRHNYMILKDLLGDGIFTVDGDKWLQQRKLSSHEFSTRMLRDFSSEIFRKNAAKLAHILSEAATSDRMIDIQLIHSKMEQMRNSKDECSINREDILSRFLQVTENDPTYLRDIILNFIIAGKDTTATTIAWFIYMVCKHPAVQEKISEEVKEATNMKDITNYTEFAASLNEEALGNMHYLHAAITETLRLYPAVPVDAKICFSDDTLPDGCSVNKGDVVGYQPYAMGRMKFIWGDDAEEFRPERWLDQDGIFIPESPFKFTAFQAGPRICLGKEFAYREMKIFSAVMLGCFQFKRSDENRTVHYRTMINLHIDGGLEVRALHRDGIKLSII
ncbi:hypothetical protein CJ030_MR3G015166 [Morella rubra]|uniref:Cytochrome P450 704C1 n=1 Tax=Morella rubra TaxID=262757 RepID=A0A6A1W5C6_9ROSI|nr:hypothetical protein CJ030_MR3G015166 [Morella rubra]